MRSTTIKHKQQGPMLAALICTALSCAAFTYAMPNELNSFGNPLVGLVSLIPLYFALMSLNKPRQAIPVAVVFAVLLTLGTNFWLKNFGQFSLWTLGGVILGYILYYSLFFPMLWHLLNSRTKFRPLLFAVAWTVFEYLKSIGFLGFPWNIAAYAFNDIAPFVQAADIAGVWPLSLLVVLIQAVLAETLVRGIGGFPRSLRSSPAPVMTLGSNTVLRRLGSSSPMKATSLVTYAAVLVATTVSVFCYGGYRLLTAPKTADTAVDITMIQQNLDSWVQGNFRQALVRAQRLSLEALAKEPVLLGGLRPEDASAPTQTAASGGLPGLVVWSESSLVYDVARNRKGFASFPPEMPFASFVAGLPVQLLVGAPYFQNDGTACNAVELLDAGLNIVQWYGKRQLVPFAELIPGLDIAFIRDFLTNVVGLPPGGWKPGPGLTLFDFPGATKPDGSPLRFGTPVCFEDAFSWVPRGMRAAGADFFINLTNNAWSGTVSAQTQHFVAARWRAVENRASLVRSTNAGYSCVIDPWGRVQYFLPMFEEHAVKLRVPLWTSLPPPLAVYIGDLVPQLLLWGLSLFVIAEFLVERRTRRRTA